MKERRAGGSPRSVVAAVAALVRRSPSVVVGFGVFAFVTGLWLWRIQHSVELSDESLSLALPLRFALGDRPFLDERSMGQFAALLVTPLVFAYHLVVRSHAGLVLFMRLCYLAFLTGVAAAMIRALRGWVSPAGALACGAVTLFYTPYAVTQFSYNTLGGALALLAMASSLRVARSTTAKEAARHAMLVGFAAAGSAFSYPTLVLLFPVHLLTLLTFGRAQIGARRVTLRFLAGASLVFVYAVLCLARSGFGSLQLTLEFTRAWGTPSATKPAEVIAGLNQMKTNWFSSLAVAAAITAVAMRFRPAVLLLAIAVPFLAAPTTDLDVADSMRFFSCIALFAPFFAVLGENRRAIFPVLAIVWAPAMLTGLVTGCTSSNKWNACGHGGFAAMIACVFLACRACEGAVGKVRFLSASFGLVPPLVLVGVLSGRVLARESVYRDVPPSEATARVRSGPFLGIWTTEKRRDLVEQMHADIVEHAGAARFVLFLPDLPSGYLSANARPAVPELWAMGRGRQSAIDAEIFRERAPEIGLVMVRSCEVSRNWQKWDACTPTLDMPADPLQAAVMGAFVEVLRRPEYSLMKRR